MIRKFWDDFLYLNRTQKITSILILCIIVILLFIQFSINYFIPTPSVTLNHTESLQQIDSLYSLQKSKETLIYDTLTVLPNNDTLKSENFNVSAPKTIHEIHQTPKMSLNNFTEQTYIKGVPNFIIQNIIKYQKLLGGYHSFSQLNEVYGINDTVFSILQKNTFIDTSLIHKLNINKAEFKEINKHPYIDYETTRLIFKARKQKKITQYDLKILLDDDLYLKIAPYLVFDE